jgi:Tfp pilus assembly protein PilZ
MTSSETHSDKRTDKRISLIQEIECQGVAGTYRRRLADISCSGMFIDTLTAFPPGEHIKLRLVLSESMETIEVTAEVVYVKERVGSGVRFIDLKPEDKAKVEELVDRSATKRRPLSESRKGSRVLVNIPVTLTGYDHDGQTFEEKGTIVSLAKNGAGVVAQRSFELDTAVYLRLPTGKQFQARVVWIRKVSAPSSGIEAGIQCRDLSTELGFRFP